MACLWVPSRRRPACPVPQEYVERPRSVAGGLPEEPGQTHAGAASATGRRPAGSGTGGRRTSGCGDDDRRAVPGAYGGRQRRLVAADNGDSVRRREDAVERAQSIDEAQRRRECEQRLRGGERRLRGDVQDGAAEGVALSGDAAGGLEGRDVAGRRSRDALLAAGSRRGAGCRGGPCAGHGPTADIGRPDER